MARYSRIARANEILLLAFENGHFDALLGSPSLGLLPAALEARLKAEAESVLGPEFSDLDVELSEREPFVVAKSSPEFGHAISSQVG